MEIDAVRWAAIERLYHAARERGDAAERAAFLDTACAGDAALRAEVESLLAHDPDASALMKAPAAAQLAGDLAAAATRFEGVRLGPYKLGALLGAGGMGEVYRAEDMRLGRDVAVKVLPSYLSTDPARRARLEREARAIAAVTHPNICALYDVGREGDVEFLVLEYVQGDTLARRLERGRLALDEALRIAREIAAALAAAHAIGIVHRDLKPANVVLTREGAKLLDFGLAKLAAPAGSSSVSQPTNAASLTAIGTILGTLQYMSPEQVEGREADARSDIFAFGAILHEMLSGMKAFEGKSQTSLIAAILAREPTPLPQLRPETPPALARIVRTCLAKDPAQRWQSAADLERELAWVREDLGSGAVPQPVLPARGSLKARMAWGIAITAVAVAAASVVRRDRPVRQPQSAPMQLSLGVATELASRARFPAISPDGRYVTFVETQPGSPEDWRIWIHDVRTSDAHSIEGTAGAEFPFWSPDSGSIAFFAKGALRRLDRKTGSIQTLCEAPNGRGGTWGPDGTIVFSPDPNAPLMRISAQGGQATNVTKLDAAQDRGHRLPFFLEDGRHFVFTKIKNTEENVLAIGSLDSADTLDIVSARGLATQGEVTAGKFIYVREGALVAQDFDMKTLAPRGERVPLVRRVDDDDMSHAAFSSSSDGTIVYRSVAQESAQVTVLTRSGARLRTLGQAGKFARLRLSPDGRKLAVVRTDPITDLSSIWVIDLHDGRAELATSGADSGAPVWTVDGKRILYQREKAWAIYNVHATDLETGRDETVIESARDNLVPHVVLPDRTVLYGRNSGDALQLWRAKPGASDPGEQIATASNPFDVRLSPDGRWMTYTSLVSGRSEIFVQGYPSGPRQEITSGGGGHAEWSADGKELYFLTDRGTKLNAAPVVAARALEIGAPVVLFEMPEGSTYAPARDGKTFYVALRQAPTRPQALMVLVNWLGR